MLRLSAAFAGVEAYDHWLCRSAVGACQRIRAVVYGAAPRALPGRLYRPTEERIASCGAQLLPADHWYIGGVAGHPSAAGRRWPVGFGRATARLRRNRGVGQADGLLLLPQPVDRIAVRMAMRRGLGRASSTLASTLRRRHFSRARQWRSACAA